MRPRSHTVTLGLGTLLLAAAIARPAAAQTGLGGATGTTTFTPDDFRIVVQEQPGSALSDFNLQRFFNVSNCQCKIPVYLFFTFTTSGFQKRAALPEGSIEFWAGQACNDTTTSLRSSRCVPLPLAQSSGNSMVLSAFANAGGVVVPTDAQILSQNFGQPSTTTTTGAGGDTGISGTSGPSGPDACNTNLAFPQTFWLLVKFSTSATTGYDVADTLAITIDLSPPPAPTLRDLGGNWPGSVGGSGAVIAGWNSIDASATPDVLGYQVLCDRGAALQVFKTGTFSSAYTVCPGARTTTATLDVGINTLDPNFVCSPLLSALAQSYRVKILENGVNYGVAVVAIDDHYNPSPPIVGWAAPQQTLSFYDVYRNGDETNNGPGQQPDPGKATGGYCAVGSTGSVRAGAGGAAVVAVASSLVALRRRRRRPRP